MKNKTKIILSIIAVSIGAALGTWFFVEPVGFANVMSFIWRNLNEPLPLVGVSIITVGGFVWAFIKTTSIGQKGLKTIQEKYELSVKTKDETIENLKKSKELAEQQLKEYTEKFNALNTKVNKMISILPNKKLKELKDEEINEREK